VNSFSGAIGVFDSGVGGLSVLRAIAHTLPTQQLVYLADTANAPYGDRSDAFIEARVRALSGWLIERGVSALVVACNTATSVAVTQLRASVTVPVIAVEPPIKPACLQSVARRIGVLATTRTVASANVERLIRDHAGTCNVFLQACPGLTTQIEAGQFNTESTLDLLKQYLKPLLDQGIDTLVLGCTHYPFLRQQIADIVGDGVQIMEPAPAVARELARRIGANASDGSSGSVAFFSNGDLASTKQVMTQLWGSPIELAAFDC
jgi:glutamate racemase